VTALTDPRNALLHVVDGGEPLTAAKKIHAPHSPASPWKEWLHPRNPIGEFTEKGGGSGASGAVPGKVIKINTTVVYKTSYQHGQVVAVQKTPHGARRELRWNAHEKVPGSSAEGRFEIWSDYGEPDLGMMQAQILGKGSTYSSLKNETGWFAPQKPTIAPTVTAPNIPTGLASKQKINDYFNQLDVAKWNALDARTQQKLFGIAEHQYDYIGNATPHDKLEELKTELGLGYLSELVGDVDFEDEDLDMDLPQNEAEAIAAIQDMSGPEFAQFMNDHFDELQAGAWADLSDQEKKALADKAKSLQVDPAGKGFSPGEISGFVYHEPFNQIYQLQQGKTALPQFHEMNVAQLNDWFDALTVGDYQALSADDQDKLAQVADEAYGTYGNVHPLDRLIAVIDQAGKGKYGKYGSAPDWVELQQYLDGLSKNDLQLWFYDNIYPEAWQNLSPTAHAMLNEKAIDNGLKNVLDDLVKGGSGNVNEHGVLIDELPYTGGLENLSKNDFKQWLDAYVDPTMWATGFSGAEKTKLTNIASKHGVVDYLTEAITPTGGGGGGVALPQVVEKPDVKKLQFTGQTLGTHGAQVMYLRGSATHADYGQTYLFKPTPKSLDFTVEADVAVSKLQQKLGIAAPELWAVTLPDGTYGSLQRMIKSEPAFPGKFDAKNLTPSQVNDLIKHQAFDWLVSQHDSHAGNFITDSDTAELVAVDKTQAFKFFPYDRLSSTYHPNAVEQPPIYNKLWQAFEKGDVDIGPPQHGIYGIGMELLNMTQISDAELRDVLRPYAEAAAKRGKLMTVHPPGVNVDAQGLQVHANSVDEFLNRAVARKNSLFEDFNKFYVDELAKRNQHLGLPAGTPGTPTGQNAAPAASVVAPNPPNGGIGTGFPIKLNTKTIHTAKYQHGEIVAVRLVGAGEVQQLFWDETKKKFGVRIGYEGGSWTNTHYASKKITYDAYKGDTTWLAPQPGSTIQDEKYGPSSGTTKTSTATQKTVKLTAKDIQAQHGAVPKQLADDEAWSLAKNVKNYSPLKTVSLSSTSPTILKALAWAVAKHNHDHPNSPQLNLLQGVKVLDAKSIPYGGQNAGLYEKKVVDWLQTAAGKKNGQSFVDWAQAEVAKGPAPAQQPTAVAFKNAYELGAPSSKVTKFGNITPNDAQQMNETMRAQHGAWTDGQLNAIKNYTGSGYGSINGSLRKGYPSHYAAVLQSAMAPVPISFTAHRGTDGVGDLVKDTMTEAELQALVGHTITDPAILSTSVGASPAFSGRKFTLHIDVPEGTPGAYVANHSSVGPGEREFLLAAGLKYRIVSINKNASSVSTRYRIHLKVVS
jgi:hypothetical protein